MHFNIAQTPKLHWTFFYLLMFHDFNGNSFPNILTSLLTIFKTILRFLGIGFGFQRIQT